MVKNILVISNNYLGIVTYRLQLNIIIVSYSFINILNANENLKNNIAHKNQLELTYTWLPS